MLQKNKCIRVNVFITRFESPPAKKKSFASAASFPRYIQSVRERSATLKSCRTTLRNLFGACARRTQNVTMGIFTAKVGADAVRLLTFGECNFSTKNHLINCYTLARFVMIYYLRSRTRSSRIDHQHEALLTDPLLFRFRFVNGLKATPTRATRSPEVLLGPETNY